MPEPTKTKTERYRPAPHLASREVFACVICGALVVDREQHDRFHLPKIGAES